VTNVLVAVVRYFGGTKLGTGGLARAYREAAARALDAAGHRSVYETTEVEIRCSYESVGLVRRLLDPPEISLRDEQFGEECVFRVAVVRSRVPAFTAKLEEGRLKHQID
jgi:putative IMPACT (imprinted ancient) family translation regulator